MNRMYGIKLVSDLVHLQVFRIREMLPSKTKVVTAHLIRIADVLRFFIAH